MAAANTTTWAGPGPIAAPGGVRTGEEPWFKFPYAAAALPAATVEAWAAAPRPADLALPPKNEYLPSDFTLRCDEAGTAAAADDATKAAAETDGSPSPPALVAEAPGLRVWHKMDRTFRVPRLRQLGLHA